MLLLLGIKQTSALTCTSTGRQQAPAGCSGLPFLLPCLLQPVNSAELKISIQPADSIFQTSPFLPGATATRVPQPDKQAFQSYLSMLTVAEKKTCASRCPVVRLLLFPIMWLFSLGLVSWVFPNKDLPMPLSSQLLPLGWQPTCLNRWIIKRKTTPNHWQALLIENQGGNHLAQGKAQLICHSMDHHLFAKLAAVKYQHRNDWHQLVFKELAFTQRTLHHLTEAPSPMTGNFCSKGIRQRCSQTFLSIKQITYWWSFFPAHSI